MKIRVGHSCLLRLSELQLWLFSASGYRVVRKIPIPGNGAWDYMGADSANRHIFVSHGPQLEVLSADTWAIVDKIVAPGVDFSNPETLTGQGGGATAAPELGRGFMTNARDGSVSIFDLKSMASRSRIPERQRGHSKTSSANTRAIN
jgi:hypothetical protein